jgi:hypothetical protein
VDVRTEFQEQLWQILRSIGPPAGARERVRQGLEERLEPSPDRRFRFVLRIAFVALGLLVGTTAAVAGIYWWHTSRTPASRMSRTHGPAGVPVVQPQSLTTPPALQPAPSTIEPPTSEALRTMVSPRIRESRRAHMREVARTPASSFAPRPEAAPTSASAPQVAPPPPSLLAQQVARYRQIAALKDDKAALAGWQAMRNEWPASTLRHEIDLNIIDTLGRLGRKEEARREATGFLEHFPNSSRAAEMRRLLHERTAPK